MRIYLPDDLLPYRRRLDPRQRRRWMHEWRRLTRSHSRYRMIFWLTFTIVLVVLSPMAFLLARAETDPLVASFVLAGMSIFFAFCEAAVVPYFFTRPELKRLIESELAKAPS